MMTSLYSAASGMDAQQKHIDVITNNLANVDTAGFKKSRADFQDLMYTTERQAGASTAEGSRSPMGLQIGTGVKMVGTKKSFTQGNFKMTGNEFDISIEGKGFFQVLRPDGSIGYTRNGSFTRDASGQLVNSDGLYLEPAIVIPEDFTDFSIASNGICSVYIDGGQQEIGQIEIANFGNPAGLHNLGKNISVETAASGNPIVGIPGERAFGTLMQGSLETSNVKTVNEMVDMITAQRAYEASSKSIQSADEMLQQANNLKRG